MGFKIKTFSVVSDAEHPGARRLARSAAFWGWDHRFIIKRDQPELNPPYNIWLPTYRAQQLGQLEFLQANPEVEFVMYLDGWDTVFTGPPQELWLERGKLNFCGDTVIFPEHPGLDKVFPPETMGMYSFPYVNIGVIWGDARVMAELAAEYLSVVPGETRENQEYYTYRYLFEQGIGRDRLKVDHLGATALNLMLVQLRHMKVENNRLRYLPHDTLPLVAHSCGVGETLSRQGKMAPLLPELEKLYAE